MSGSAAKIYEVFNSIQGEGLYVGERQIFIRFAGCNLSCQYCDTPQKESGCVELEQLIGQVKELNKPKGAVDAICLTGGEPLLQVDFIKNFLA